jgi:hypothetical protein
MIKLAEDETLTSGGLLDVAGLFLNLAADLLGGTFRLKIWLVQGMPDGLFHCAFGF